MKILHVISMGYVAGGAEKSVVMMQRELESRGHEVKVFASDSPGDNPFSNFVFRTISPASPLKMLYHLFYRESYTQLKRAIADFQPDVIHFHTLTSCSPSVLFAAAKVPSVLTIHGPEEFTLNLLPWFLSPDDYKSTPFELADLNLVGFTRYWYYRLLQRPLYQLGFRKLAAVIAPSRYIAQATKIDFGQTPIEQIYNGIAPSQASPLPKEPRLLFVGRLEKVKGVHILLKAFAQTLAQVPAAKLRIVGDGPQRGEFEQLAATLGITSSVDFAGWIPAANIAGEHAASQGLVVPSVWPENLPTVCIEAMAAGRPVIGSDTGGIPELIDDNRTGFIVPVEDVAALATAMTKLLTDTKLRQSMSEAAARKAAGYSVKHFIDQILNLYKKVTS